MTHGDGSRLSRGFVTTERDEDAVRAYFEEAPGAPARPPVWRRGDYWAGVAAGVALASLLTMVLRMTGVL